MSDPWMSSDEALERRCNAAEERVRVLEADIEAVWDQYREACGILNDRVRVLTETLASTEAVCKDYEAWLDDALKALGVPTVFDIPRASVPSEETTP
jgi:hypothetical protein